jgi:hypothetical protein
MASVQKVQAYLAYWFQLGKPVVFATSEAQCLPEPIFQNNHFSLAFEQCWQKIMQSPDDCYLKGTDESIATLLTDEWEIVGCARCPMPQPMPVRGIKLSPCPCSDMPSWPNDEIPQPRSGVCTSTHLDSIRERLQASNQRNRDRLQSVYHDSPNLPPLSSEWVQSQILRQPEKPFPDVR